MRKYIKYIFLLLLIPAAASAEISVSINFQRYEAALVDSIKMTVSISGTRDAETPDIKGLENFIVQTGGRSSRIQIINGKVSSNLDFTYYLQPKRIGIFEIGPASIKSDGKVYQSEAVKLIVKSSVDKSTTNSPIFLTANLSSKAVYTEEQLEYYVRLYYSGQVSNVSLALPDDPGLSFKQIGKPAEYDTVANSRNYHVIEVRYSLIPSKTGRFNINPAKMTLVVHSPRQEEDSDDLFSMDDFFSRASGRQVTLASNPLLLDVLPIPEYGKPADYAGLIGTYSISSELSPGRIKAGESTTLTVTVKGFGNVNRIPDLKLPEMENIKIYSDEPKLEVNQSGKGEGVKTMKWAIVPVKEGTYTLPSLSISFFDTTNRMYRRIYTRPMTLPVDRGSGIVAGSPFTKDKAPAGKEEVEELGKDILPIHRSAIGPESLKGGWHYFIILLPVIVYVSFTGLMKIKKIKTGEGRQFKESRAANYFIKTCKDNKDMSADLLSSAFKDYYNNRFNYELGLISPQEASVILKNKGCFTETINQAEWILKKIETRIYTGKGGEPCDLSEDAVLIVKSIEKEVK